MSARDALGTWPCPPAGHVNDGMRHTCRDCGAHRPCEHWDGTRHCGAVPVHMYPDGPRCEGCRTPITPPPRRGGQTAAAGGGLALELGEEFTVGEWARAVRQAADRVPRQIEFGDGEWRPNPAHAAAEREVAAALRTVALHLGIPLAEVGPCSSCAAYCHRYGPGESDPRAAGSADHGRPLCAGCQARALAVAGQAVPVVPAPLGRAA